MRPSTVCLFVFFLLSAQRIDCASARDVTDLCGVWDIQPDTSDAGLKNRWYEPGRQGAWQPVVVPSSWETVLGTEFDGVAWYRKQFRVDGDAHENRVLLRFHGAATEAHVWVNGREAGSHTGPWTPFTLDVTSMVDMGEPAEVVVSKTH